MQIEKNYDFRKRMQEIHKTGLRNDTLVPKENELVLADRLVICLPADADDVILTAAKDFADFLFTSMDLSVMLKKGRPTPTEPAVILTLASQSGIDLEEAAGYRGYRIAVDMQVRICGYDSRGIAQALYALEDIMSIRHAPYIPKGLIKQKPAFSPQMVHSGYGLDEYPNEHLAAIAHEGRDAILVFTKDVDITPYGYLDFNDLIYRAAKYGIDVYAYSYLKSEKHPNDPDAESYYEANYGKLFAKCPGLKGVTLVGESVEFPSKDEHVTGKSHRDNVVEGIPTGKTSPGWYPCMDFPKWLELIKKVIRSKKPDADIVFWTYNWGYQPEEARLKLIEALPTDITLQATFEMFETFKLEGSQEYCADYTLSFEGYGAYFKSEAIAAKKRGIKLHSMTNTGGLTWDFGVVPYLPFPYQWMKRYRAMREAHDNWDLTGLMESHHFGFYPSFISKLSKMAFTKPWQDMEALLYTILEGEFGMDAAPQVDKALRLWSDASTHYIPSDADQYGAFRVGPSYPFCLYREINLPAASYSMFGNRICAPVYPNSNSGRGAIQSIRLPKEIRSLEIMRDLIGQGLDILNAIASPNENLLSLINLGRFIWRSVITGIHAKQWQMLKTSMHAEQDKEKLDAILADMEVLLKAERANAEETIPLVQIDSRLGWEPSMEYMTDEAHLRWKLRQVDYVLQTELAGTKRSLELA